MPATRAVLRDIGSRADLDALLRRFYAAAFADPLIGPYFTEIAGTDLDAHLPGIGDFWERALFRSAEYRRDAYAPHAALHAARPLTAAHFGRWVQLWRATVDGRHAGPVAERAKAQGSGSRSPCCGGSAGPARPRTRPRASAAAAASSRWPRSRCGPSPRRTRCRGKASAGPMSSAGPARLNSRKRRHGTDGRENGRTPWPRR
ncbi:group III truncated hemoglobin [Streptomyces sp. SBR177]